MIYSIKQGVTANVVIKHSLIFIVVSILAITVCSVSRAAQQVIYYHNNLQGSVIAATDEQGNLLWRQSYLPFGKKIESNTVAASHGLAFTGHVQDQDTGLLYMQARYYDPRIGRFLSQDPVGFVTVNPISFNRYAYGNNNPYKYTDPDGREVRIQWHEVLSSGSFHSLLRLKPDNQSGLDPGLYANIDRDGKRYATIGAGPEGFLMETLVSNVNRKRDVEIHAGGLDVDIPSFYKSERAFIDTLLELDQHYNDDLDYDFWPDNSEPGNNSNSYISGLLDAAGAEAPVPDVNLPGYDKPVVREVFGR